MIDLTVYLVECSLLLALLYSLYWVLLRKGRLFTLNRFFLISVFAGSFLIPLIDISLPTENYTYIEAPVTTLSDARMTYYEKMDEWMVPSAAPTTGAENTIHHQGKTSWLMVGLISLYLTGVALSLIRMGWIYFTLLRLKKQGSLEERDGLTLVKLDQPIAPFSFLKYVFVSAEQVEEVGFQQILDHERTHIRERHSIDLMIVQFLAALQWFNPAAWWLIKSLKTTHEYRADQQMISKGYSVNEYQTLLLQQLISNNSYGLVHNFNLTFIKKRIAMMKIQKIGWTSKSQMALALCLGMIIAIITVQCNAKIEQLEPEATIQEVAIAPVQVNLPVIAANGFKLNEASETDNAIILSLNQDGLYADGIATTIDDLGTLVRERVNERGVVIMRIDQDQTMGMVRSIQNELRVAGRRKLLYSGLNANGSHQGLPILLPPPVNAENSLPEIDDAYIKEHDLELLYLNIGIPATAEHQATVYEFVVEQMERGRSNYVVSAKFDDDDLYKNYLANLQYVNEGFNQIYDERAKEMYGKGWWEIDRFLDDENRAQYNAVRKGIPRAISIAEK
ncbi:MAG: M56 family metallopeptidase [Cytophagales bacterium]|nr:M56 family metallopeptidase [Cytophagales bacterium]